MSNTPTASRSRAQDGPSLRERLRSETREAHEALDACFADMFAGSDPALYPRFVAMNLAAHETVEPLLASSALARPPHAWQAGDRLAALRRDARALGVAEHPAPPFPFPELDLFEALGVAYVLEGSRLGAKFMLKGLRKNGGVDASLPTHYLEASGDAQPFADLLAVMAELDAPAQASEKAVRAADATFRFFRDLALRDHKSTPAT